MSRRKGKPSRKGESGSTVSTTQHARVRAEPARGSVVERLRRLWRMSVVRLVVFSVPFLGAGAAFIWSHFCRDVIIGQARPTYERTIHSVAASIGVVPYSLVVLVDPPEVRVGEYTNVSLGLRSASLQPREAVVRISCGDDAKMQLVGTAEIVVNKVESAGKFGMVRCRALQPGRVDITATFMEEQPGVELVGSHVTIVQSRDSDPTPPSKVNLTGKWAIMLGTDRGELSLTHKEQDLTGTVTLGSGSRLRLAAVVDGGKVQGYLSNSVGERLPLEGDIDRGSGMVQISGTVRLDGHTETRFLASAGGPGSREAGGTE